MYNIDREEFENWLNSADHKDVAGTARNAYHCPIARFIKTNNPSVVIAYVDPENPWVMYAVDDESIFWDEWMTPFVQGVDNMESGANVTFGDAKVIYYKGAE